MGRKLVTIAWLAKQLGVSKTKALQIVRECRVVRGMDIKYVRANNKVKAIIIKKRDLKKIISQYKNNSGKDKGKKKYKHIYFESKKPGRDSVYQAVKDIGKEGVNTREEFIRIVLAQLCDAADYKTVDHSGRKIKFTVKLWNGRMLVLRRLNKKKRFNLTRLLNYVDKVGKAYLKRKIGPFHLAEAIDRICKGYGVSTREAREIVKKTNEAKKFLKQIIKDIDGVIRKEVSRVARHKKISRKQAYKEVVKRGRRIAKRLKKVFDAETKEIAAYLWKYIPKKYKKKPHRIWYYVMVLWLAYYIRKYSRDKGMDWRTIDWASEIDWRQGYRYAKDYVISLLHRSLEEYSYSDKEIEEMMRYYEEQARIHEEYGLAAA